MEKELWQFLVQSETLPQLLLIQAVMAYLLLLSSDSNTFNPQLEARQGRQSLPGSPTACEEHDSAEDHAGPHRRPLKHRMTPGIDDSTPRLVPARTFALPASHDEGP